MTDIQDAKKAGVEHLSANELENLYTMYFTPQTDVEAQPLMFEQVSIFDYSLQSYSTDSVAPSKVSYA